MASNYPEYMFDIGYVPTAIKPEENARLGAIQQKQRAQAQRFREAAPQYAAKEYAGVERGAKQDLAQRQKDLTKSYNARGLLRSGMALKDSERERYSTASDLANKRYEINQKYMDIADQLEDAPINTAFGRAGLSTGADNSLGNLGTSIRSDIASSQANSQLLNSILGGLGTGAGYYFGSMGKK